MPKSLLLVARHLLSELGTPFGGFSPLVSPEPGPAHPPSPHSAPPTFLRCAPPTLPGRAPPRPPLLRPALPTGLELQATAQGRGGREEPRSGAGGRSAAELRESWSEFSGVSRCGPLRSAGCSQAPFLPTAFTVHSVPLSATGGHGAAAGAQEVNDGGSGMRTEAAARGGGG